MTKPSGSPRRPGRNTAGTWRRPRRLEAENAGLTQFMHTKDGSFGFVGERPAGLPTRETRRDIDAELERFDQQKQRPHPNRVGGVALAGSPRRGARIYG